MLSVFNAITLLVKFSISFFGASNQGKTSITLLVKFSISFFGASNHGRTHDSVNLSPCNSCLFREDLRTSARSKSFKKSSANSIVLLRFDSITNMSCSQLFQNGHKVFKVIQHCQCGTDRSHDAGSMFAQRFAVIEIGFITKGE